VKAYQLLLTFVFFLYGCSSQKDITKNPVLVVDQKEYLLSDFSKDLALRLAQQNLMSSKNPSVVNTLKNRLLSDFIITHLINEDLKAEKIEVTEQEINSAMAEFNKSYENPMNFKEELINANVTESQFREIIASELRLKKFFAKIQLQIQPPTEADCIEFYNRNKGEYYMPHRILLRQIVVKQRHQAEDLLEQIHNKTHSFEELARNYSIGPESINDGLIGWIEEGQISIFDHAFKLKPNQISSIIESAYGYHIFRVEKKEPKQQLQFSAVKDKIFNILVAEQEQGLFLKWLDERLRKIKIKKNDQLINALIIETKGESL
jgi:parvulin-like peptidyl-prolyl isomerase